MGRAEDFDRLGDLLGNVCDAASAPTAPAEGTHTPGAPGATAPAAGGRAGSPGASSSDPARALALVWTDVMGPDMAANARPVQLNRGRLVVSTSSSAWAQTLGYMEEELKAKLNDRLGSGTVKSVVFRHAGWEERPRHAGGPTSAPEAAKPGPLSQEQADALAKVEELGLPSEIRDRIVRAMKASFVRGQQESVR